MNVTTRIDGNKPVIECDLSSPGTMSASGKSAFIVSKSCMDRAVEALIQATADSLKPDLFETCPETDPDAMRTWLGRRLYVMNRRAIRERYGETVSLEPYTFTAPEGATPEACAKALHCLRYQCTEGNVPGSKLYKQMERLLDDLDAKLLARHPGYTSLLETPEAEAAPWD
jgi:hypothetical protein